MKKLISMLLTVMLVLSLTPSAFATTFVPGKTAEELTRDELLACLTTYVVKDGRTVLAQELTTDELCQVYVNYLGAFSQYLARTDSWKVETSGTTVAVGPASKFTDVPQDAWYLNELHYAVCNGYISGTGSDTFSPDGNITRGQFVTILGRMLGADATNGATKFTDVPEKAYYAPFVGWAASKGYVNGTSATTFAPDKNITFEQMGTILANFLSKEGVSLKEVSGVHYADASKISGYAVANMEQMRKYGLITPDSNGNVNPQNAVTRADGAVSLVRLARGMGLGKEPTFEYKVVENTVNLSEVEQVANRVHDELWASGAITSSMTEKEKAEVYFKWMCLNCRYHDSDIYPGRHTAYGALVNGVAVCDGLSYAYYYLLKTEGITSNCIPDWKNDHMWVEAQLDNKWYRVDVTDLKECCNPDGSFNKFLYEVNVELNFGSPIPSPSVVAK